MIEEESPFTSANIVTASKCVMKYVVSVMQFYNILRKKFILSSLSKTDLQT